MLSELILFGAGKEAYKTIEMLNAVNCKVLFIVDNDISKIGQEIYGIKISSPKDILESKAYIYITSVLDEAIIKQLINMGVSDRLISKVKFLEEYIGQLAKYIPINDNVINLTSSKTLLFDNMEGVGWGGIERWNFLLANNIKMKGYNSVILSSKKSDIKIESEIGYEVSGDNFIDTITEIVNVAINNLPVCIINNWEWEVMIAACFVKSYFPDKVKIISTMHCDEQIWMKKIATYQAFFDSILCVSSKIAEKMKNKFNVPQEKVHYRANFVDYDLNFEKKLNDDNYLKIGYAGRLEKSQKRADLIINLIEGLERTDIKYQLSIAGTGTYFDILNNYISENNLTDKVYLKGLLSKDEMKTFWQEQDISVNLSDFEGMSLMMLEAMAEGAVPVMTDVSGVDDIIIEEYNGYIVNKEDIDKMIRCIKRLDKERTILKYMSDNARKTIKDKCNIDKYANYLLDMAF